MSTKATRGVILIRNGRVYDQDGNVDLPPIADLLIVDGVIAAVRPGIAQAVERGEAVAELGARAIDQTIDATEKLVMPGFVNAHYHSHDVLLKGCFETIPLELWVLSALPPSYPEAQHRRNPRAHLARRARMPAQRNDDGAGPLHDLSVRRGAPRGDPAGLRGHRNPLRLRAAIRRQGGVRRRIPFWEEVVPPEQRASLAGAVEPFKGVDLPRLLRDIVVSQRNRHPRLTLALGPTSPERCTPGILTKLAELSDAEKVPVYTHIYEFARDDADRAPDPPVGRRLADQLSQAGRAADSHGQAWRTACG